MMLDWVEHDWVEHDWMMLETAMLDGVTLNVATNNDRAFEAIGGGKSIGRRDIPRRLLSMVF